MLQEGNTGVCHNIRKAHKELVHAELRVIQVRGCAVHSKPAIVEVDKISLNGLRFLSSLVFPVLPLIGYKLKLTIINKSIELSGSISRRRMEDDCYSYDMSYDLDASTRAVLSDQLGELSRLCTPLHLKADYYYHFFAEPDFHFQTNRIDLWS